MTRRVVLAYSGGLDTSIIIPYLKEEYGLEVHCFAGDVGQGSDELDGLEEKALASGAASCHIADLTHEFVSEVVWPCLRALAVYEGRYLLGTSMARPVLARGQVAYAKEVGAQCVAHGCTGKGNDQVRFELAYMALAPELEIIAPWRDWDITSREDALEYAARHEIPVAVSKEKIYSRDRNLWHISHEGGALEDPAQAPPDDVWMLTANLEATPDQPALVDIGFDGGVPVSINGTDMPPAILLEHLNQLGGEHGIGRVDITENRLVGMKSRGVYETPGGTILYEALRSLRALTMERDTLRACEAAMLPYTDLVYTGRWFHPLRASYDAFFERAMRDVCGVAAVKLFKGQAVTIGCKSPSSLYSEDLATFGSSTDFDHADSRGFIKLYGLPGMTAARVQNSGTQNRGGDR